MNDAREKIAAIAKQVPGFDPWAHADAIGAWFDADAAIDACNFFADHLKHIEGDARGKPFILRAWQAAIVANLWGWKMKDDDGREVRRFRKCLIYVPRGNGKALDINTPIPTTMGWKRMGDLGIGDVLFDECGKPTNIVGAFDVMHDHKCYRVVFDDGTSIVADAEHLWETDAKLDRERQPRELRSTPHPTIKTTEQIRQSLVVCEASEKKPWREYNHRIKVAEPLDCEPAALPINPYVLGAWLGDGDTDSARLTCSEDDSELIDHIRESGTAVKFQSRCSKSKACRFILGSIGRGWRTRWSLQRRLRLNGLLGNKHIPAAYMRGSIEQRMELLAGLMDTDGYVSKAGQCEFTSTLRGLAEQTCELVRSLGYKPTFNAKRMILRGRDVGECYVVRFNAFTDAPCCKLSRKSNRLKARPQKRMMSQYRQIVAVDEVESRPVRCIAVDSPSKLFLAGTGMVPTHNTPLSAGLVLLALFRDAEPGAQVYLAAGQKEQAGILFRNAKGMIAQDDELTARSQVTKGDQRRVIRLLEDPEAFCMTIPAEASGQHGGIPHVTVVDELHVQESRELLDVFETSMAKRVRKQPMLVMVTTADYDRPSPCNEVYQHAQNVRDNGGDKAKPGYDPHFLPVIYEAGPDDDWKDEAVWRKANPNLGVSVSLEMLRAACNKAIENPAFENAFRRLHLNQRTSQDFRIIPIDQWDSCEDVGAQLERYSGMPCYAGLDLSSKEDLTSFAIVIPLEAERIAAFCWSFCPQSKVDQRAARKRAPYDIWARDGWIETTPGNSITYEAVRARILAVDKVCPIQHLFADPFNARETATILMEQHGFQDRFSEFPQTMQNLSAPTKDLIFRVKHGSILHDGNPVLRWAIGNVSAFFRGTIPEGQRIEDVLDKVPLMPSKRNSADKIDPVAALVNALAAKSMRPSVEGTRWNPWQNAPSLVVL